MTIPERTAGLPERVSRAVRCAARVCGPGGAVVLFGSRARGDAAPGADFDVAILPERRLSRREMVRLRTEAGDLAWPYSLDLVDLSAADERLRESVRSEGVLVSGDPEWRAKLRAAA